MSTLIIIEDHPTEVTGQIPALLSLRIERDDGSWMTLPFVTWRRNQVGEQRVNSSRNNGAECLEAVE
jgi:hypothetical protein